MKVNLTFVLSKEDREAIAAWYKVYRCEDVGEVADYRACRQAIRTSFRTLLSEAHGEKTSAGSNR